MAKLKTIFGIDLRTLALFRVMLAIALIADLMSRARDLRAFYTDLGVLPRADLIGTFGEWRPSLHLMSGSATMQGTLFLISGSFAFALLVGYRTRLVTVVSWVLLISLQARNNIISQGGDALMLMLLFWAMFLPLGARFSVDAALDRRGEEEPNAYFSMATMALLVQCMSVYFFSALLKSSPVWIPDGTAVYYALHLDYLATPFAVWFRQFPAPLTALTYFVWCLELSAPFLMFSPLFHLPLRLLMMALLIAMHVGFFLCLEIGLFPLISITSLIAFTPGWVWDRIGARVRTPERRGVAIYYDGPCDFCLKVCLILKSFLLLRDTPIKPAQDVPDIHRDMQTHNSWVVVDHDASRHVRWGAIALVFRRSPLFVPLGALLAASFMRGIGERIYELVARNRARLGEVTALLLPYRNRPIHPSTGANVIIGALMLFVIYINLTTLPGFGYRLPRHWDGIRSTLRLGQTWNMFAPAPSRFDGWYIVRGVTRDGMAVDVLHNRQGEPDLTRPQYIAREYPTYRWRKYMNRIALGSYRRHRAYFAEYLCRMWNSDKPRNSQLVELKLYFNQETILPDYAPRRTERLLLDVHQCAASGEQQDVEPKGEMDQS